MSETLADILKDFCDRRSKFDGRETVTFDELDDLDKLKDALQILPKLPEIKCWVIRAYFRGSPVFPDGVVLGCKTKEQADVLADALRKHQEDMGYSLEDQTSYVVEEGSAIYDRIVLPEFLPEHLPFAPWDLCD